MQLSAYPSQRLYRLAFDGPFAYGRRGAHWYEEHHALARLVSQSSGMTVHAYLVDPEELEQVITYGGGNAVGGERLRYEDAELPEEIDELDELAFERIKDRWPLGHLAKVLGVSRRELLRMPRAQTALLELDAPPPVSTLKELFPALPAYQRSFALSPHTAKAHRSVRAPRRRVRPSAAP